MEKMLDVYQEIVSIMKKGERAAIASIVSTSGSTPRKVGAKMVIKENGNCVGTIGGGGIELDVITNQAPAVIKSGKSQLLHYDLAGKGEKAAMVCGGKMDVLVEPILPSETLFLFGAGHIAESTAKIAGMLGFNIVVIDPRPDYNNNERFPDVDNFIVDEYESAFTKLNIGPDSYIVIYTTGHVSDAECLHFAVKTDAKYIGMIGSKKKVIDVKERLLNKKVSPKKLDEVHAPIGIDIGAETPEEIAISILAEIIRVKRVGIKTHDSKKA
jgi:xanthine dehydrogenase accessory factor